MDWVGWADLQERETSLAQSFPYKFIWNISDLMSSVIINFLNSFFQTQKI